MIEAIGEALAYVIQWFGMILNAFPDWFAPSATGAIILTIAIIKIILRRKT